MDPMMDEDFHIFNLHLVDQSAELGQIFLALFISTLGKKGVRDSVFVYFVKHEIIGTYIHVFK